MRTILILVFSCASLVAATAEAQRFHGHSYGRGHRGLHQGHSHFGRYGRSYLSYGRSHVGYGIGFSHYRLPYTYRGPSVLSYNFRTPYYSYNRVRSYYAAPYVTPYYSAPLYNPYCAPTVYGGLSPYLFGGIRQPPQVNLYVNNSPRPAATPAIPLRDEPSSLELRPSTPFASKVLRLKNSNLQARTLARSLMVTGDRMFGEQRYHEALQKYKSAAKAAPDMAEAHFRQGHGYIATNRYEQAAKSFKLGAALTTDVTRAGFKLDDLYKDSPISKSAHLDALAQEALEDADSSDLLFLVGVFLYYDGQADRADRFFGEAASVSPRPLRHLAKYQKPKSPAASESVVTASLPGEVEL